MWAVSMDGACTIMMDGRPVRSCLVFGVQANNTEIITVEGLAIVMGSASSIARKHFGKAWSTVWILHTGIFNHSQIIFSKKIRILHDASLFRMANPTAE